MFRKLMITILIFGAFIILFAPHPHAFTITTRRAMVEDAIKFCPAELKTYLVKNIATVKDGMTFVDRNPEIDYGPEGIKSFYSRLISDLKSNEIQSVNTVRKFGLISCYIAEIINPCNKWRFNRVPQATEDEKIIKYDGHQEIDDIDTRLEDLVADYEMYYSFNKVDRAIIKRAYGKAVNEIVDYWVSAWTASGNNITQICARGKEVSHVEPEHPCPYNLNPNLWGTNTGYYHSAPPTRSSVQKHRSSEAIRRANEQKSQINKQRSRINELEYKVRWMEFDRKMDQIGE